MALSTKPYKGSRDFYPEDMRLRRYVFSIWRSVAENFGYEEYETPLLEPTEIYAAKTGEEIVNEQSYRFEDRGGRDVMIRPEMTPSVSRMVAGRRQEMGYPARLYSIANFMRYERPQRGRLREFSQINIDIFGVATIDAEIELIQIADMIMQKLGAKRDMYSIKINSRKLVVMIMADYLRLDAAQTQMMTKLLDKRDKMPSESFYAAAEEIFAAEDRKDGLERLKTLLEAGSMADLPEDIRESNPVKEVQLLFTLLHEYGIENAQFDVSLMRGLDYYTDIVFEVFDADPENNRSVFGGGRYDGLVGMYGVAPLPTAGFAIGDVSLQNFLESHNLIPELEPATDLIVIPVGEVVRESQGVAGLLRNAGLNVAVDVTTRKLEKQIKAADKLDVKFVMFVGNDELNSEEFQLKNLDTGETTRLSIQQIIEQLL